MLEISLFHVFDEIQLILTFLLLKKQHSDTFILYTWKRPAAGINHSNTLVSHFLQVYLKAPMILNGVCVIWRGWIDLQRLDGMGLLEYDEERAQVTQHTSEENRKNYTMLCP